MEDRKYITRPLTTITNDAKFATSGCTITTPHTYNHRFRYKEVARMPTAVTQHRPNRRHVHEPNGPDPAIERCPWCKSKISRAEYERICNQIAEEERGRLAKAEQALRQQLAGEQRKAMATAKVEVEKAKRDAAAQIDKARKEAAARETAIRKQATEAATVALIPKIAAAVADAKAGWHGEKVKLTAELEALKRKVENTHMSTPERKCINGPE
jgi:hypothetical protein